MWSQDAKLQKRVLSIADKYIKKIIPNAAIRKNIIPDTPSLSGITQEIYSKENFFAKKQFSKTCFMCPIILS